MLILIRDMNIMASIGTIFTTSTTQVTSESNIVIVFDCTCIWVPCTGAVTIILLLLLVLLVLVFITTVETQYGSRIPGTRYQYICSQLTGDCNTIILVFITTVETQYGSRIPGTNTFVAS